MAAGSRNVPVAAKNSPAVSGHAPDRIIDVEEATSPRIPLVIGILGHTIAHSWHRFRSSRASPISRSRSPSNPSTLAASRTVVGAAEWLLLTFIEENLDRRIGATKVVSSS